MPLNLLQKLEILADAAKYDASCASSGGEKRNTRGGGLGSVTGAGICHAYTPDGRCVSLLKILTSLIYYYLEYDDTKIITQSNPKSFPSKLRLRRSKIKRLDRYKEESAKVRQMICPSIA